MPAPMVEVDERRCGAEVVIVSSTTWSITGAVAVGVAIAAVSSAASSAAATESTARATVTTYPGETGSTGIPSGRFVIRLILCREHSLERGPRARGYGAPSVARLTDSKIRRVVRNEGREGDIEDLGESEHCAQRRVGRSTRPGLAFLVLLVRVPGHSCTIGDVFLTEASLRPATTKRCRNALRICAPRLVDLLVPSSHISSVATRITAYGLFGMA